MCIFTLGHSTHSVDEFVNLARRIAVIVDVRSHPTSRHCPQWDAQNGDMIQALADRGLGYRWMPKLGGWTAQHMDRAADFLEVGVDIAAYSRGVFPKQRIGALRKPIEGEDPGPSWTNRGLYDYAWYTMTEDFLTGIDELVAGFAGERQPNCALVCSEALWWKCHRSMIADHLAFRGVWCAHLPPKLPKNLAKPYWTVHADAIGNRLERYPRKVMEVWEDWSRLTTVASG